VFLVSRRDDGDGGAGACARPTMGGESWEAGEGKQNRGQTQSARDQRKQTTSKGKFFQHVPDCGGQDRKLPPDTNCPGTSRDRETRIAALAKSIPPNGATNIYCPEISRLGRRVKS